MGARRVLAGVIQQVPDHLSQEERLRLDPHGACRARSEDQITRSLVAGTVGHLLTELWHEHSAVVGRKTYERLLPDCEAFGEALQTVNILKDIAWDVQHENAVYVPSALLAAAGSSHATVLRDDLRTANRAALEPLIRLAQDDVEQALRYIEALPAAAVRIRLFCVLPILFAVATLRARGRGPIALHNVSTVLILWL